MGFVTFLTSPMAKYLMFALLVTGIVFGIYRAGENHIQDKWDAANLKTEKEIAELKIKADKVTVVKDVQFVDKVKIVTVKGDAITREVPVYITPAVDAKCIVPNNFVLLHDYAARNIDIAIKLKSAQDLAVKKEPVK
jgi:hypothetical protein